MTNKLKENRRQVKEEDAPNKQCRGDELAAIRAGINRTSSLLNGEIRRKPLNEAKIVEKQEQNPGK
jgi:hypothetical protein